MFDFGFIAQVATWRAVLRLWRWVGGGGVAPAISRRGRMVRVVGHPASGVTSPGCRGSDILINMFDRGVHYHRGVPNFWFYLFIVLGTCPIDFVYSYNVSSFRIYKAAAISVRTLTVSPCPCPFYPS